MGAPSDVENGFRDHLPQAEAGARVQRPDHVWAASLICIRLRTGFVYLMAIRQNYMGNIRGSRGPMADSFPIDWGKSMIQAVFKINLKRKNTLWTHRKYVRPFYYLCHWDLC
jgi:hypothetical protein